MVRSSFRSSDDHSNQARFTTNTGNEITEIGHCQRMSAVAGEADVAGAGKPECNATDMHIGFE